MNRKEKRKRKEILKIKRETPEYKLRVFWHRYRKNFSARNLILITREVNYPEIQKSALREFLIRQELTFDDFYEALGLPEKILELNPKLENALWRQCLDLCTPDHLVELIGLGEKRAAEELFQRINKKSISMRKAKQILIWLFEKTNSKDLAEKLWEMIETIGPNEDELKYLLDLKKTNRLSRYIERLLSKKAQKKEGKAISKIKGFVTQIKQRQE